MKNKCIFAGLILATFSLFIACGEKDDIPESNSNNLINEWIYEQMSMYYLWNEKLPKSPNYDLTPDQFFNSICYRYDKNTNPDGDRFSWIQENYVDLLEMLSGVSSDEIGFEFMLYYMSKDQTDLIGEVEYVKKGTPAETKGLKRGQMFTHVNGTQLKENNYQNLLMNLKGNFSLTVYDVDIVSNMLSLQNEQTLALSTLSKYEENPVYLDTVYTNLNGKNIGYLVYNFFADDNGDGKYGYDAQLAQVFAGFKAKNITDLILDLRYNSGGSTLATTCLAGMIVKGFNTNDVFFRIDYNKLLNDYFRAEEGDDFFYQRFFDKIIPGDKLGATPIPLVNIGNDLQNFYVLSGRHTASASELIINGLRPYMKVTLLGDTTVGKNVGSISIYEKDDPENKWGMQPIIVKMYNKNNESNYTAGFVPEYLNQDRGIKRQLGNLDENMLEEAVYRITGATWRTSKQEQTIPYKRAMSSVAQKAWSNQMILNYQQLPNPGKK